MDASHTYTAPGTFTATLTVTDSKGAQVVRHASPVRVDAPNTSCFGARSDDFAGTALDRARWTRSSGRTRPTRSPTARCVLPTAVGDLYGGRNDATNLVLQPAPTGPGRRPRR